MLNTKRNVVKYAAVQFQQDHLLEEKYRIKDTSKGGSVLIPVNTNGVRLRSK